MKKPLWPSEPYYPRNSPDDIRTAGKCVPMRTHVPGSPFQPKDTVRVVDAIDQDIHDVSQYIGRIGRVVHLDYSCGCGQRYPDDPSVGVKFTSGKVEEFWAEELERVES